MVVKKYPCYFPRPAGIELSRKDQKCIQAEGQFFQSLSCGVQQHFMTRTLLSHPAVRQVQG